MGRVLSEWTTSTHIHPLTLPLLDLTVDEYTVTCSSSVETPKNGTYNVLQDSHGKVLSVVFFSNQEEKES